MSKTRDDFDVLDVMRALDPRRDEPSSGEIDAALQRVVALAPAVKTSPKRRRRLAFGGTISPTTVAAARLAGKDRQRVANVAGGHQRRFGWAKRRIRIGGFAVAPIAVLAVVATAAAATTAVVTLSATTLFQNEPQGLDFNGDIETVLPSTVRQVASVSIPDYGQVQVWGATTKPGGFCFAMMLPDGDWAGLHDSQNAQDGFHGGSVPGCVQTREQQILKQTPLKPGQQPSGTTGQLLYPEPVEAWDDWVKNADGKRYTIYVGYVEVQGTATTVRDPDTGATTQVLPGGYYVLTESSGGDDIGDLQALNAAGQALKPDYTWGEMLPGYSPGPSQS